MNNFWKRIAGRKRLAVCTLTLSLGSSTLSAAKGSLAPPGVTCSQNNGAPSFMYRSPVYRTDNIPADKPVPSNDWWTGILVRNDLVTMAAYPLVYALCKAEGNGLSIAHKDAGFVAQPVGAAVLGYSKRNWKISSPVEYDLVVYNSQADGTVVTKLDGFGDWQINLLTVDNTGHEMSSTLAAGSPISYHSFRNGQPKVHISDFDGTGIQFFTKDGAAVPLGISGSYQGDHVIVRFLDRRFKQPRWYGLFAAEGTVWKRMDANNSLVARLKPRNS
jgi:endoglucanase Acf2